MGRILDAARSFLTKDGWPVEEVEGNSALVSHFMGENGKHWRCLVWIDEDKEPVTTIVAVHADRVAAESTATDDIQAMMLKKGPQYVFEKSRSVTREDIAEMFGKDGGHSTVQRKISKVMDDWAADKSLSISCTAKRPLTWTMGVQPEQLDLQGDG